MAGFARTRFVYDNHLYMPIKRNTNQNTKYFPKLLTLHLIKR